MSVRTITLAVAVLVVVLWGLVVVQRLAGPRESTAEPECRTEVVADEVHGMRRVEVCK